MSEALITLIIVTVMIFATIFVVGTWSYNHVECVARGYDSGGISLGFFTIGKGYCQKEVCDADGFCNNEIETFTKIKDVGESA